jgi:hypothetical protein
VTPVIRSHNPLTNSETTTMNTDTTAVPATNDAIDQAIANLPTLADRTMLAVLRRTPLKTARKMAEDAQEEVRELLGDESASVSAHLFKDKTNPVRQLIMMDGQAYADHRKMTSPWVDAGPRLLNSDMFDTYRKKMNKWVDDIRHAMETQILPNWDDLVRKDMEYRKQAAYADPNPASRDRKLARISILEYPDHDQIATRFNLTWRVRPVGNDDSRCKIPQWQKDQMRENLMEELNDAVGLVRKDLAQRMLEPIEKAIEKLSISIEEKNSIFRESLIENLSTTLDLIKQLNVTGEQAMDDAIAKATKVIHGSMPTSDALRSSDAARSKTVAELDDLKKTFDGLMGGI